MYYTQARDPEDYRLTFRMPPDCNVTNCTIFVGIDSNNVTDDFLDVYMTGETEAWLAVGFSDSRSMVWYWLPDFHNEQIMYSLIHIIAHARWFFVYSML